MRREASPYVRKQTMRMTESWEDNEAKQGRLACQPGAVVNFHHISNALERQSGQPPQIQDASAVVVTGTLAS